MADRPVGSAPWPVMHDDATIAAPASPVPLGAVARGPPAVVATAAARPAAPVSVVGRAPVRRGARRRVVVRVAQGVLAATAAPGPAAAAVRVVPTGAVPAALPPAVPAAPVTAGVTTVIAAGGLTATGAGPDGTGRGPTAGGLAPAGAGRGPRGSDRRPGRGAGVGWPAAVPGASPGPERPMPGGR